MMLSGKSDPFPLAGYAVGIASIVLSAAVMQAWWESLAPALTAPFLIAITITAWLGGLGPALLATALSAVCSSALLFIHGDTELLGFDELFRVASFLMVALITCALNDSRKKTEAAMRERDERLQLVSEQIPAGLWSTDTQLRMTSAFGAGLKINPPRGQTMYDHFATTDETFPPIAAHLRALRGESGTYEQSWNGRTFESHVEPLRNPEGAIIGVVGVNIDITQRKRTEEGLKGAKEEAEAATQAKDQFLAMLSHELRTPLTPVLAAASALEMQSDLPPQVLEDVRMMRRNIELEATLIDDLLDLTRISRGKLELQLRPVDAHQSLRSAIDICNDDIAAKQMRLTLDLSAREHTVRADPPRLQQVLWNLLKNAVKFSSPGGKIHVSTENVGQDRIRISVRDEGIGIAPEMLTKIFNAFEQGRSSITRKFGGLGLGLAISKALIDEHKGQLSASSAGPGKGATFSVELQTAPIPAPQIKPEPRQPPAEQAPAVRILLIEDHPDTLRMMQRLLERSGHQVTPAASQREALRLAEGQAFDLIISDLGLPDGSGLELIRQLRSRTPDSPPKAIALSGYGMESDIEKSRRAGFAEHLTKPVNFRVLEETIERLVSTPV